MAVPPPHAHVHHHAHNPHVNVHSHRGVPPPNASTEQFNDAMDDIAFAEQRRHRQMGFTRGYSIGEEAGWRDGYIFGMRKGAQLSAEIGYYQGFAHAWITLLEREDASKQRKINALNSLLEMTRAFPKSNTLMEDDTIQKLARIRAKFKQVNALILGGGANYIITTPASANVHIPAAAGNSAGPFGRGTSWTSQDSGAGSYGTASLRGMSPNPLSATGVGHSSSAFYASSSSPGVSGIHAGLGPKTEMSF